MPEAKYVYTNNKAKYIQILINYKYNKLIS